MEWLAVLGADKSQVLEAVKSGFAATGHDSSMLPVKDLIAAHFSNHRHQSTSALQQFTKLEQDFPNNIYLLLKIATYVAPPCNAEMIYVSTVLILFVLSML